MNTQTLKWRFSATILRFSTMNSSLLSFYQLIPPLGLPGNDEGRKIVEEAGGVTARCVAKIAIPRDRMASVVVAIVENFAKHQRRFSEKQNEDGANKLQEPRRSSDQET
jgi:hypothetical protein